MSTSAKNAEPTIEEWFSLFIKSRDAAKKALGSPFRFDQYPERYSRIMTDADSQIRSLLNRMNQLTRDKNNDQ